VQVTAGSDRAGVLQDSGSLTIAGGSLELASSSTASSVASLSVQGGALTGAGSLDVSGSLSWTKGATMSGSGSTVLQSPLDSPFHEGAWVSLPISVAAAGTVTVTVDRLAGHNAVLSGIFLGGEGAPPAMPVTSAPKGDWVGVFGTDGYDLFAWNESSDLASLPDESVSLAQGSRYRWTSSTSETQALESPEGSTRRAATLYDPNQLKLQLEFTSAYTGELSLYALDWDSGERRELVTVDGQTADLSSDFSKGAWVSFPISVAEGGVVPITVDRLAGANAVLSGIFLGTAVPPANTAAPSISGTARDGLTLSASTGSWEGTEPFEYSYQWESCNESGEECRDIEGATGSHYVPGPSDIGNALRVVVTSSNAVGAVSSTSAASAVVSSPVTLPVSSTSPEVSGTTQQGQTLRASTGAWMGAPPLTYSYQWERCNGSGESCADIEGATGPTYELDAEDVSNTLRVVVQVRDGAEDVPLVSHQELQAQAAEEFRNLHYGLPRIDREYYYMYTAPTKKEQEINIFDSALLEDENTSLVKRPAYCVLAYEHHVCPPTVTARSSNGLVVNCGELPLMIRVDGSIEPNGGKPIIYHFEYGPTSAYGHSTTPKTVPGGWDSLNVEEAVPDTVETLDQGCVAQVHFRLVATNAQGSRHSTNQTAMLNTINGS
jgi:hypothetical protein